MAQTCEEKLQNVPARRYEKLTIVVLKIGRGRPKKYWRDVIRRDMTQLQLTEDMTVDRTI